MGYAKQWHNYEDINNHSDAKRFEIWSIVLYVGESNMKMPSYKERDLFYWLDIKDQIELLLAWVMRSSGIFMRILIIIVILKGLRVGLLCYMWVILM